MHIGLNIKKKNYSCKSYNFFLLLFLFNFAVFMFTVENKRHTNTMKGLIQLLRY